MSDAAPSADPAASLSQHRTGKLSAGFKLAYGSGQFIESVTQALLGTFFFFYITNVCGLSGSLTGLALFIALSVDAVADPVIGSVSDNLKSRWGRRIPVMAVSLVPVTLTTGLLFCIPRLHSSALLFGYVLTLMICLRVAISGYLIPYQGLGAELSDDYDERSSIVAFRAIFGVVATLICFALGFGVFLKGPHGLLDWNGYVPLGWAAAGTILIAGGIATVASLRALPRLPVTQHSPTHVWRRLFAEAREVFHNPAFRWLFGGVLVFFIGQGVVLTLALDGNKFFWGLREGQIESLAVAQVAGLALGVPVAFALIGRIEKRTAIVAGIIVICATQGALTLAQLLSLLPASPGVVGIMLTVAALIFGLAVTVVYISFQSAMADAVDEHEYLFKARREGLYFASLTFAAKAATGIGSLISGLLLDAIRFPSQQIASGDTTAVAPQILRSLGWIFGPGGALLTAVSVLFFYRYRLTRAVHARIRAALDARSA